MPYLHWPNMFLEKRQNQNFKPYFMSRRTMNAEFWQQKFCTWNVGKSALRMQKNLTFNCIFKLQLVFCTLQFFPELHFLYSECRLSIIFTFSNCNWLLQPAILSQAAFFAFWVQVIHYFECRNCCLYMYMYPKRSMQVKQ